VALIRLSLSALLFSALISCGDGGKKKKEPEPTPTAENCPALE
jgi:hypothetical protein